MSMQVVCTVRMRVETHKTVAETSDVITLVVADEEEGDTLANVLTHNMKYPNSCTVIEPLSLRQYDGTCVKSYKKDYR